MKAASTILFLFKDSDGFGTAIADALHPNPNSSLRRLEDSFELSLEGYGIKDHKARGNLVHFIDNDNDNYQVSILLLEKYEPPTLVCALNEVLSRIIGEASSSLATFVVPFIGSSSMLKWESKTLTINSGSIPLYGVQMGPETDVTRAIITRTQKPPSLFQIHYEPLACLLQLVHVLKLPTLVLIGQIGQSLSDKASGEELEILHKIGELLANTSSLCFLREKVKWNPVKMSRDSEKPWRTLYG